MLLIGIIGGSVDFWVILLFFFLLGLLLGFFDDRIIFFFDVFIIVILFELLFFDLVLFFMIELLDVCCDCIVKLFFVDFNVWNLELVGVLLNFLKIEFFEFWVFGDLFVLVFIKLLILMFWLEVFGNLLLVKLEFLIFGRDLNKFLVFEGVNWVFIEEGLIVELVEILFEVCLVLVFWFCGFEEVINFVIDGWLFLLLLKFFVVINEFEFLIFLVFLGRMFCENWLVWREFWMFIIWGVLLEFVMFDVEINLFIVFWFIEGFILEVKDGFIVILFGVCLVIVLLFWFCGLEVVVNFVFIGCLFLLFVEFVVLINELVFLIFLGRMFWENWFVWREFWFFIILGILFVFVMFVEVLVLVFEDMFMLLKLKFIFVKRLVLGLEFCVVVVCDELVVWFLFGFIINFLIVVVFFMNCLVVGVMDGCGLMFIFGFCILNLDWVVCEFIWLLLGFFMLFVILGFVFLLFFFVVWFVVVNFCIVEFGLFWEVVLLWVWFELIVLKLFGFSILVFVFGILLVFWNFWKEDGCMLMVVFCKVILLLFLLGLVCWNILGLFLFEFFFGIWFVVLNFCIIDVVGKFFVLEFIIFGLFGLEVFVFLFYNLLGCWNNLILGICCDVVKGLMLFELLLEIVGWLVLNVSWLVGKLKLMFICGWVLEFFVLVVILVLVVIWLVGKIIFWVVFLLFFVFWLLINMILFFFWGLLLGFWDLVVCCVFNVLFKGFVLMFRGFDLIFKGFVCIVEGFFLIF